MFSVLSRVLVTVALVGSVAAVGPVAGAASAASTDWRDPLTLAPPGATDARAAVSASGDMTLVWVRDGAVELRTRPADGDWAAPEVVAASGATPRAAYDGSRRLLVVWAQEGPGSSVAVMARTRGMGGTWADPIRVALRPDGPVTVQDLAVNSTGGAVIGWVHGFRGLVSRGGMGGGWTTNAGWSKTLDVEVALGDGGLAAVMLQGWTGPLGENTRLLYSVARQPRGGSWAEATILQSVMQDPPWIGPGDVAVDRAGTTTVAYQRLTGGDYQVVAARAARSHAFGAAAVLADQPTRTESPVRVLATPAGTVLVTWVHDFIQDVKACVHRPGAGWSSAVLVGAGPGIIVGWDVALAADGHGLVAVSRARTFKSPYGTTVSFLGPAGHWTSADQVTTVPDSPVVGIGHGDAVVAWTGPQGGIRARITE